MAGKFISIEVDSKKIKIGIVGAGKNPQVFAAAALDVPYGAVDDGYLIDRVKLSEIIRKYLTENKIKVKSLVFTINSSKIASREAVIPLVKDDRIKDVVYANAAEYFPFRLDEYCLSYQVLEKVTKTDERKLRLMVYAAPDRLVQSYYDLAASLSLKVEHLDYYGNSSVQLLQTMLPAKTNFIVQISEESTLITILSEGRLRLQRTIPYGVGELKEAVLSSMGYDVTSYEQAEELLREEDLLDVGADDEAYSEAAAALDYNDPEMQKRMYRRDLAERLEGILRYLYEGVTRVMDYFIANNTGTVVDSVYLTGAGASYKALQRYFRDRGAYEAKPLTGVFPPKLIKLVEAQVLGDFLSCAGAGIEPLDFVPLSLHQPKAHTNRALFVILIFSAIASFIMVGSSFMVYMITTAERDRIEGRIEELSDVETVYHEYMSALSDYKSASEMTDATRHNSEFLGKVILELEEKLPKGVILEGFSANESGLSFSVTASSKEEAARTILQLRKIPYFASVETGGITHSMDAESGGGTVTFSIQAVYFESLHGELAGEEEPDGNGIPEETEISPEEEIESDFTQANDGEAETE